MTGLLALIVNPWYWTAFGSIIAFWAGPFTPATTLQVGLALLLKKIFKRSKKCSNITEKNLEIYNEEEKKRGHRPLKLEDYNYFSGQLEMISKIEELIKEE